jgi:hypothetical protein
MNESMKNKKHKRMSQTERIKKNIKKQQLSALLENCCAKENNWLKKSKGIPVDIAFIIKVN